MLLILPLILLPGAALGAQNRLFGEPVLKIIYAAESRGNLHPCFY